MAGLCNEGAYLRIERGTRFRGLRIQVRRDNGGGRPDRGRGLQNEPAAREIEVVAAERLDVAIVEAVGAEAEHQHERRPTAEQAREELRVDLFLRIGMVRGDDDVAELRWKAALRELEREETSRFGELPEVLPLQADRRGPGNPGRGLLRRPQLALEREAERREVRVEGEGHRRRPGERASMGFGEFHRVVRIVQADRHAAARHRSIRSPRRYFELVGGNGGRPCGCPITRSREGASRASRVRPSWNGTLPVSGRWGSAWSSALSATD